MENTVVNKNNNTIEPKKAEKEPSKVANAFSTVTLVLQILLTLGLGGFALAPKLAAWFGISAFAIFCTGALICTVVTVGTAWISQGFRNFWGNFWNLIVKAFKSPDAIKDALKPNILWILLPLFFVSLSGFIYNLIYFIKYDHKNEGRFITSCIFGGLAIINLVAGLVIYLK